MTTRVEQINTVAIDFGKVLLSERPALYPYAAVLLPNGEKSMMSLNFDEVSPAEAEERLVSGLVEDASDGAIVAASWGYTVDVTSNQGTFSALKVLSEARGESPRTTYIPYEMVDGRGPVFGNALEGPERSGMVFRAAGSGTGKGAGLNVTAETSTGFGAALQREAEKTAGRAIALQKVDAEKTVGRGNALRRLAEENAAPAKKSAKKQPAKRSGKKAAPAKKAAKKTAARKLVKRAAGAKKAAKKRPAPKMKATGKKGRR